ncbi:hypothetical protein [Mesorhizobium sp. SP-1A]|uniref:hypothetical protein n=1 Tax=Mesorhizobium sp. SP-1A TaxID=3077840 RepID=UPI0028F70FDF|nr:hypothetical protein [Mesorhizobium sp. SP-1A]
MYNRTTLLITFGIIIGSAATATAASVSGCQKEVFIPAALDCAGNTDSKFADFSTKCTHVPARVEYIDIECPGRWVQVTNIAVQGFSHANACKASGLKASNLNGRVCASGERRPQQGGDWSKIKYSYGTKGNGNGFVGGNKIEPRSFSSGSLRDGNRTTYYNTYCYDTYTSKKNNTREDQLVAVYCE